MPPKISRFDIHDELTAPKGSAPILKGALSGSGKLNNFVGVLAGSPAALRAYARMRSELRHGTLAPTTQERIALAVAEYRGSEYDVAVHARVARNLGLSLDEVEDARRFFSRDEKEAALLRYLESVLDAFLMFGQTTTAVIVATPVPPRPPSAHDGGAGTPS